METQKRAWKLQEFVAHSSDVTCLALGPTSGRVMVTGGEDMQVNMWAVGKPDVIMSLSGHTSHIECVQFNGSEELVCAGSQSGALKIWDLEAAKIVRTLTGHQANVKCLDFHPYGEFVCSGSSDTTVRLWDVRRKGCLFSYQGHTNAVNHLRFSPDGRWVISAGEDGFVKLWDLSAGKLLADFVLHAGPVNRVEFHPKEFLVATGSTDRTVKCWDLENFGLISSSDVEASAVRVVGFHPEGLCLFTGGLDSLRAYGWEPSICYDAQTLGWGRVADIAFSSNQLIGASFQSTTVQVWVANMNDLEERIQRAEQEQFSGKVEVNQSVQVAEAVTHKKTSPHRKSFVSRPKTSSSKTKTSGQEEAPSMEEFNRQLQEKLNAPDDDAIFQPSASLRRSPVSSRRNPEPFSAPQDERFPGSSPSAEGRIPKAEQLKRVEEGPYTAPKPSPVTVHQRPQIPSSPTRKEQIFSRPMPAEPELLQSQSAQGAASTPRPATAYADRTSQQVAPQPISSPNVAASLPIGHQIEQTQAYSSPNQSRDSVENRIRGLNINEFSKDASLVSKSQTSTDEDSALSILDRSHNSLCQIMEARLRNLSLVSRLWTDGDIKGAVEAASGMADPSVFVDLMNVLILRQTLWNLDVCGAVLPQLKELLASKYESYVDTASYSIKLILKNFSQVIKSTMHAPPLAVGVDLAREERYEKCQVCYTHLQRIRQVLTDRTHTTGRIGTVCRELSMALSIMD